MRRLYDPILAGTPITSERLQKFLIDNRDELGLRFVELRPDGNTRRETVRVGEPIRPLPHELPDLAGGPWQSERFDDRIRVFARTPPPRPRTMRSQQRHCRRHRSSALRIWSSSSSQSSEISCARTPSAPLL